MTLPATALNSTAAPEDFFGGDSRPGFCQEKHWLAISLALYALLALPVAICQRDYINADFIAYVTIAKKVSTDPAASISGVWSPLYSWLMVPLLRLGMADLAAGRAVLLAAGVVYVALLGRLMRRFAPPTGPGRQIFLAGMAVCAAIQGAEWSTKLLVPDILARALILAYLALILDPGLPSKPLRAMAAGLAAGLGYLAKGYMLPFAIAYLGVVWLLLGMSGGVQRGRSLLGWVRAFVLVGVGIALVAGPWIAVLSSHYGRLTFSTAGVVNHANLGPGVFKKDLLWHPPLEANFIILNP